MFWLFGLLMLVLLFIGWLLISLLEVKLDTRIPEAELSWKSIGGARIWFDQKWLIRFRILFFSKTLTLADLKKSPGKPKKIIADKEKSSTLKHIPGRILDVVKSFELTECKLALDTGDHALNARLYPLNHAPYMKGHLFMNFNDENYFVLKVRNRPWKIIYAFFRRSFN